MSTSAPVPFHSIFPNKTDVEQSKLDISERNRYSLFTWNGQFSPLFIETMLTKYSAPGDIVYDPFSGSGTVLVESARLNLTAYGIELNPSAYYMSKFSEISNIDFETRNSIVNAISNMIVSLITSRDVQKDLLEYYNALPEGVEKNTLALLIILCDVYNNELNLETIGKQWTKIKKEIYNLPLCHNKITSFLGDARRTPVEDDTVSLILTSPPYINVFNYHQNYRRSVELLGYDVLSAAKTEFGSNRKNRGNRFLTVIQYTIDMALSFRECMRISKINSRFIFVVGRESNVLSTKFCNSNLLYRIGTEIFGLQFTLKQERCFKNRFGQMIYEDILHFTKESNITIDYTVIVEKARDIALQSLIDALEYVDSDHRSTLEDAISKVEKVKPSEEVSYE